MEPISRGQLVTIQDNVAISLHEFIEQNNLCMREFRHVHTSTSTPGFSPRRWA